MFESLKSNGSKVFDEFIKSVKEIVAIKSNRLVEVIDEQQNSLNPLDCNYSNLTMHLENYKSKQFMNMTKTFNRTITFFTKAWVKCRNVNMETRCMKLIVSFLLLNWCYHFSQLIRCRFHVFWSEFAIENSPEATFC